ncbi:MAG TPA: carboxypeptidase-like regulatory domain-containing protein [Blastocatellia bacterium]|nr:carboxypeptidase-like regulatory domain-containing protein [Blastocatellia bacterium]
MTPYRCLRSLRFFRFMMTSGALSALSLLAGAQSPPKSDAITGRVIGDDGNPIVNASVSAIESEARGANRIQRAGATDDEGNFRLTKLPPGLYSVSASAEGYLSASMRATESAFQQGDRYFRPGASLTITLKKGGVITGRVTNTEDRPVVAVPVSLEIARDEYDRPRSSTYVAKEGWTDDRGVYRFFGLRPGSYLVRAGGRGRQDRGPSAFDSDTPTYYPSATREAATEVRVHAGEEANGIDIRYRGERGHSIRGVVAGAGAADITRRPSLSVINLPSRSVVGHTDTRVEDKSFKFEFEGLPDGEYELIARRSTSDEEDGAASTPHRVTIKGADINGIELRLIPYSSLSGRFVLASDSADCQIQNRRQVTDVALILHRNGAAEPESSQWRPDQQGEFMIRGLGAGRYRLGAWLPHMEWYLRAVTTPGTAPAQRPTDVSRQGLTLRPGERKTGLIMTVAEGAVYLTGKVIPAAEGASLPSRLRVYLVPAEAASADDALRYAEADVERNGRFVMRHLAPGRYWLLAREAPDEERFEWLSPWAAWDAASRAKLLREAGAAKVEIELQACKRAMDQTLRYEPR